MKLWQMFFYRQDGVAYTREYFISNPGNVMAVRLTADRSGNINKKISVNTEQPNVSISVSGDTITMAGRPSDHTENGLKFAQQVKVVPEGGNLSVENGAIVVNGADAITIYMSAGTNYQVDGSTEYNYFSSEDPLGAVRSRVNTAAAKGYSALRQEHVSDYQALYSRVKVNLGASEIPSKTTDQLLAGYSATNTAAEDPPICRVSGRRD